MNNEIPAKLVFELRDRTGASMMECKKALAATGGDLEKALDLLRKTGLKSADRKASRDTGQGQVACAMSADGKRGAMLALCCETDFAAKGDEFAALLGGLCQLVLDHAPKTVEGDPESLLSLRLPGHGDPVGETIKALVSKTGENIRVTQMARLETQDGRLGSYVHFDKKKGALVAVETSGKTNDEFLKQLCMHVVAAKPSPEHLTRAQVPAEAVERERSVLRESDDIKKKPAEMHEKIIQGRMEKFYAERVLPEQPWILDDKLTVQKAMAGALGPAARIESFARFHIGG